MSGRLLTVHGPASPGRPGTHFETFQVAEATERILTMSRSYTCQRPEGAGRCPFTYEDHATVPSPTVDRLKAEIRRLDRWFADRIQRLHDARLRRMAVSEPGLHDGIAQAGDLQRRALEQEYDARRTETLQRLVEAELDRASSRVAAWLDTVTADDFDDAAPARPADDEPFDAALDDLIRNDDEPGAAA